MRIETLGSLREGITCFLSCGRLCSAARSPSHPPCLGRAGWFLPAFLFQLRAVLLSSFPGVSAVDFGSAHLVRCSHTAIFTSLVFSSRGLVFEKEFVGKALEAREMEGGDRRDKMGEPAKRPRGVPVTCVGILPCPHQHGLDASQNWLFAFKSVENH